MIKGFDKETAPLCEYETGVLLPIMIKGLQTKIGKRSAIKNGQIVKTLKSSYKITEARVRKLINHIRTNDIIPGLIATSEGYYTAQTENELIEYEESLKGRENAIREVRVSIERQRKKLYSAEKQTELF